jgi:hypothetical protein
MGGHLNSCVGRALRSSEPRYPLQVRPPELPTRFGLYASIAHAGGEFFVAGHPCLIWIYWIKWIDRIKSTLVPMRTLPSCLNH